MAITSQEYHKNTNELWVQDRIPVPSHDSWKYNQEYGKHNVESVSSSFKANVESKQQMRARGVSRSWKANQSGVDPNNRRFKKRSLRILWKICFQGI